MRSSLAFPSALVLPVLCFSLGVLPSGGLGAQEGTGQRPRSTAPPSSSLRHDVERYTLDREALLRRYRVPFSPARRARMRAFYQGWRDRLETMDYESLGVEGRIDFHLLRKEAAYRLELLDRDEDLLGEMEPMVPFATSIMEMEEERRSFEDVDPRAAAARLSDLARDTREARERLGERLERNPAGVSRIVALRAEGLVRRLGRVLADWQEHYHGYDPLFTWWTEAPFGEAVRTLDDYADFLREGVVGQEPGQDEPIVGDPIGEEGMAADLAYEMIPYTPRELIAIGEAEFAWCQERMLEASRELGFGEDWRAALEHVKTLHVSPGEQPALVRRLAVEAVDFVEARSLLTIPPLAKEIWRLEMMSPEAQKVSPFFLGGEVIRVSFPTHTMSHDEKLQSMRGNNEHFSRATVQHELIPGHHLQQFMYARYNPHRTAFYTPFWIEGNALYWEMLLWDLGFPRGPEDRVGMLFWRMHRAARIIFSLSFHLGIMSPQEAIDFLVERVGHERANARAEVRRSFNGSYSPLYQAAYMLGGLQLMALREELVDSGGMTDRAFHDAVLQGGIMPMELVRARLRGDLLPRDFQASWRFAGDPE